MPYFSQRSKENLESCRPELMRLFYEVIKYRDCSVIEGYEEGLEYPSKSVHVVPEDNQVRGFGEYVKAVADIMGIGVKWNGGSLWEVE